MTGNYIAKHGDCITSIADEHGFFWGTVWEHEKNKELREKRKDPNTLVEGDIVFIPEKRKKQEEIETGKTHTFNKKGVPALFRVQLLENEEFLADLDFELNVKSKSGNETHHGTTTAEGIVEAWIPTNAISAMLYVGPERDEYSLDFGVLPPIDEIAGIQVRLQNLGFFESELTAQVDEATAEAISAFQQRFNLTVSGEPDQELKDMLLSVHDNPGEYPPFNKS